MTVAEPARPETASSQAIAALILGIIGIIPCCSLLGPVAWFIGNQEQKAIRQGRSSAAGEGIAKIAVILGIIGTVWIAGMILWIFFMGGMAVLSGLMNR